jgi:hypothetical protein
MIGWRCWPGWCQFRAKANIGIGCPIRQSLHMDWPDYLRDEAAKYRQLAEQTDDPVIKIEMLELASVCEEVASNIEDHLTGG